MKKLTPLHLLPMGTRFRYTGDPRVFILLERVIHEDNWVTGTICSWEPTLIGQELPARAIRQQFFHLDSKETPEGVEALD